MTNTHTQSILLLTSHFSRPEKDSIKPLTPSEWGRFAQWLNEQGNTPSDLITNDPRTVLQGWTDSRIALERIEQLLNRGHSLALALEKWSRAGIWVLTRSDASYPRLLKHHLRTDAPPVLYGCGNKELLNRQGVSVVGSRNASENELDDACLLGQRIVEAGYSVVSGGAKGVDETTMLGGLSHGGTVVGILADSLLRAATTSKWRQGLMNGNLVLVSPFYPEAGFNKGNAMARNKYIYCLSQAALVVHSGVSGGTWSGALENLKKDWVPLWVKQTEDSHAGNPALVAQGGKWLKETPDLLDIGTLLSPQAVREPSVGQYSVEPAALPSGLSFYQLFLEKMQQLDQPVTAQQLTAQWALPEELVNAWLKQSMDEGRVNRLTNPVRYQWGAPEQPELNLHA
ncbi:DNA-processing protein DprA [Pseudomonas sp. 3A(2025)]